MYQVVPIVLPGIVSMLAPGSLTSPKSLIIAIPEPSKRMFSGLTSRWISPFSCSELRPVPTSAQMRCVSSSGSRRERSSRSRSEPPLTKLWIR